jgi:hypothetical protein
MHGIGRPGSAQAQLWTRIAAKHGVACPYGVNNPAEWNHCQPTRIKMVQSNSPLVKTIAPQGPINPLNMFEAGKGLIESVAKLFASFGGVRTIERTTSRSGSLHGGGRSQVMRVTTQQRTLPAGEQDKAGEVGGRGRGSGHAAGAIAMESPGAADAAWRANRQTQETTERRIAPPAPAPDALGLISASRDIC